MTSQDQYGVIENYAFFTDSDLSDAVHHCVQTAKRTRERYNERVISTDVGIKPNNWPLKSDHGSACYIRRASPPVFGWLPTLHKTEESANVKKEDNPPYLDVNYEVVKGTLFYAE